MSPQPAAPLIVPFERAAVAQSDRGKRVKQRDYLVEGRIPVIDQGQSPVGGYTNDEDFAFIGELPVVLFGDHTRAVKFVDRRFAVGADGIKIFRPAEGVRAKYLYYWMKSAPLPDRGYGRHYQYLRQLSLPLPSPRQQDEIVAEIEKQFSRLDAAAAGLHSARQRVSRYLEAASDEAFLRAALWPEVRVGAICEAVNGRAFKSSEWRESGVPIVRIQNLKNPDASFNHYQGDLDPKHKIRHGDLLFAWSGTPGTSFGAHIWEGADAALNQHIFRIDFDHAHIDRNYFCFALNRNVARYVAQAQGGVGLAHITKAKFMASVIALPPLTEQVSIVSDVERRQSFAEQAATAIDDELRRSDRLRSAILARSFGSGFETVMSATIVRGDEMKARSLPRLPPRRESEAEDMRLDIEEVLLKHPRGLGAEELFKAARYQGDQVDQFYRDLARLRERLDTSLPGDAGSSWPFDGSAVIRLRD